MADEGWKKLDERIRPSNKSEAGFYVVFVWAVVGLILYLVGTVIHPLLLSALLLTAWVPGTMIQWSRGPVQSSDLKKSLAVTVGICVLFFAIYGGLELTAFAKALGANWFGRVLIAFIACVELCDNLSKKLMKRVDTDLSGTDVVERAAANSPKLESAGSISLHRIAEKIRPKHKSDGDTCKVFLVLAFIWILDLIFYIGREGIFIFVAAVFMWESIIRWIDYKNGTRQAAVEIAAYLMNFVFCTGVLLIWLRFEDSQQLGSTAIVSLRLILMPLGAGLSYQTRKIIKNRFETRQGEAVRL